MKKQTIDEARRCPKCGQIAQQIKKGRNRSGTQRCKCLLCGTNYTLEPKSRTYSDEVRQQAIKTYYSGVSGRGVGALYGMGKENVVRWIKKRSDC